MSQEYGAPNPPRAGMPAWAWCLIVPCGCSLLSIPILAAILFPVFAQARESARAISCLSNIKQQGTSLRMYLQDYDDKYPQADQWMDLTQPYYKNDIILHCPSVSQPGTQSYGYAFNKALSRTSDEKIKSPQTTVMLYDSTNLARNATDSVTSAPNPARHRRGNNVGYADGHARNTPQYLRAP